MVLNYENQNISAIEDYFKVSKIEDLKDEANTLLYQGVLDIFDKIHYSSFWIREYLSWITVLKYFNIHWFVKSQ